MHLLYADESGNIHDPKQRHFVFAGISVPETNGYWLSLKLDGIASRFDKSNPDSIELHGYPMYHGKKMWHGFPEADRRDAIKEALRIFTESPAINRIFACVVLKSACHQDVLEYVFQQFSSRFDMFLMRLFRKQHERQRGIIICDKTTFEATLQSLATDFRKFGHQWGVLRNLAEVPLFLDSRASRLIQLADLVAYSIFRNFECHDSQFYSIIQNRFDCEGGMVHGLHLKLS